MEKKKWSSILIALCLALAFSVSSVEAQIQQCENGDGDEAFWRGPNGTPLEWPDIAPARCDRDEDCFVKRNTPCQDSNPLAPVDCDDNDFDPVNNCSGDNTPGPDPEFAVSLEKGDLVLDAPPASRMVCDNPFSEEDLIVGINGAVAVPIDFTALTIQFNSVGANRRFLDLTWAGPDGMCDPPFDEDNYTTVRGGLTTETDQGGKITEITLHFFSSGKGPSPTISIDVSVCDFPDMNCVRIPDGSAGIADLGTFAQTCVEGVPCFTIHLDEDAGDVVGKGRNNPINGTVSVGDLIFTRVPN